jgi:hypothetical protein
VCFWTEDGQHEASGPGPVAAGGPNGEMSLSEARLNFLLYGASHRRYADVVRLPRPDEMP